VSFRATSCEPPNAKLTKGGGLGRLEQDQGPKEQVENAVIC
jgi:hypothetical protein